LAEATRIDLTRTDAQERFLKLQAEIDASTALWLDAAPDDRPEPSFVALMGALRDIGERVLGTPPPLIFRIKMGAGGGRFVSGGP
jgi:hypothetical protein